MWYINTEVLGSCILWIIAIVSFVMVIVLTVVFTQRDKDLHRLDKQVFGPFEWWTRRRDYTESRIDTLYKFHRIVEKDVLEMKNKIKPKKKKEVAK